VTENRFKVLVSDIDWTLLGPSGDVHPADAEAIFALKDAGVHVTLCTGRMFTGTQPLALELELDAPLACVDGSHIAHSITGSLLACAPLPDTGLDELFRVIGEHGIAPFAFSDRHLFHDGSGAAFLEYVSTWSEHLLELEGMLVDATWRVDRPVAAVLALGSQKQVVAAELALASRAPGLVQSVCFESLRTFDASGDPAWALLVRAAGVDKGTALDWLARHYGVTVEETVAVGDWLNDVPMLKRAGLSFAMAQAPEAVRNAAHHVLEAHGERGGGIAEAAKLAGLL
jgi:hydroxymethylpyrimidine pyrophosphatase-like HAD family hydrolase